MTMERDPFQEYFKQTEPEKRDRGYAWYTAIGLQAVDCLETSQFLQKTAIQNIEGNITMDHARKLLDRYYEENPKAAATDRTEEADKVAVRIAKLLLENAFVFSPMEYLSIHKNLFRGIYSHAGRIRDYNISKKEWVLNGASVVYGSATELRATLEYDLEQERNYNYKGRSMEEIIRHLALFAARLWQIHVFAEGNTRTTAVFLIKYLRTLGFHVTNDIFAKNAWYFRNALVRANYNDLKHGVHETTEFLELFLRNLLLEERNELRNRRMHISGALDYGEYRDGSSKKQDIKVEERDIEFQKQDIKIKERDITLQKQDFGSEKQDIDSGIFLNIGDFLPGISQKTVAHIQKLYASFGQGTVFGRSDVMEITKLTASPASSLIQKLREAGLIVPVKGMGKGKYKFTTARK